MAHSERVSDEVLEHLQDADDCHINTEIFQSLIAEVRERRQADRVQEPIAYIVTVRYPGGTREYATLPDYYIAANETLVSEIPLFTHVAPQVPDGMVMVPREPTKEMLCAAWNAATVGRSPDEDRKVWSAMLAAAPSASDDAHLASSGK